MPTDTPQDRAREALIERIGTFCDLLASDPLDGAKGDVAYDMLRQAAAQISSDRLRLASPPSTDALREALEPFARAADKRQVMCDDAELVTWSAITVGDLRRARQVLSQPPTIAETVTVRSREGLRAAARCIEIARQTRDDFLSEDYAVGQPVASFKERFACDQVAHAIEDEFGLGTNEQCRLLGKPKPGEQFRAAETGER